MSLVVNALSPVCGAEILGLDDISALTEDDFRTIRRAFLAHGFIVFRGQRLTPAAHESLSRRFGALQSHILKQYLLAEYENILVLSNKQVDGKPVGLEDAGRYWHTDVSYEPVPPLGSMLYAIEIPKAGGDTLFANQYLAYDRLPNSTKVRIAGLSARHVFNYAKLAAEKGSSRVPLTPDQERQLAGAVHPIVRTHPETGRKALYVNPGFTVGIEGLSTGEGADLLEELWDAASHPAVTTRHVWEPHDAVLWDNRCLMHHATTYDRGQTRHMHRTTISGTVPV